MSRGIACLMSALAFLAALAVLAVSATACEGGGGGGAELTTLSTKLSGESKEGEELTVLEGAKVKDKATLSGKNAAKATGKVTYKVYSDKECKTSVISAGEVTVSGESVPASSEEELEGGKTYYWQAHYGGDAKNAESTSPCTEILNVKAKTSLSTKLSGESKEGEELTVLEGSEVKDKATLSGTNSSTAGGKALYKVFSDKECKTLVTEAGEVTVSSGSVPASSEEELEGGNTYYWQVAYKGDGLHQESTSGCGEVLKVNPVTCTFPYCEPTITPGVQVIMGTMGTLGCTAGPIMTEGTEQFLLTAGHCLEKGSTGTEPVEQEVQSAYPAAMGVRILIGKKITFNNSTKYDTAEVKIENTLWLREIGGAPPLLVEWGMPRKVTPVLGKALNLVSDESCLSGATSRLQCGEILRVGVTVGGVENLNEASAKGDSGDSGGPEFLPTKGGVMIQGTVAKVGAEAFLRVGKITLGSKLIMKFLENCGKINEMKTKWAATGVPAEGAGIPPKTTVKACKEEITETQLEISEPASANGSPLITIGHTALVFYEPMSQIEAVYPGQTLLVR